MELHTASISVALGLASMWLLDNKAGGIKTWQWKYTITRFGLETWCESKLTCYERQTIPFLTFWSSVANYQQHNQRLPPAQPFGNAHEAERRQQCSTWQGHLQQVLDLLCHLGQAAPWPCTSARRMITRLKLLQGRDKIQSLKKMCPVLAVLALQSGACSPLSLSPFWF